MSLPIGCSWAMHGFLQINWGLSAGSSYFSHAVQTWILEESTPQPGCTSWHSTGRMIIWNMLDFCFLVKAAANVNAILDVSGEVALMDAALAGDVEVMYVLFSFCDQTIFRRCRCHRSTKTKVAHVSFHVHHLHMVVWTHGQDYRHPPAALVDLVRHILSTKPTKKVLTWQLFRSLRLEAWCGRNACVRCVWITRKDFCAR